MFPFTNIRCWCTFFLCAVCLTGLGASRTEKILTSSAGDKATVGYSIDHKDGKVIIKFDYVNDLHLSDENEKSYYKIPPDRMKVIFMDGTNFDEEMERVEKENHIDYDGFTTPSSWKYSNQSKYDHVFCLNEMTSQPQISFTGERDKQKLKIPIYLAYTTKKVKKDLIGRKKGVTVTYHVFSEFEPLEIELSNPKQASRPQPNPNPNSGPIVIPVDDSIVIPDNPEPIDQKELELRQLMNKIRSGLQDAAQKSDYEAKKIYDELKPEIDLLETYKNGASPETQGEIDSLKNDHQKGLQKAIAEIEEKNKYDAHVIRELEKYGNRLDSCSWSWSYLFKPFDELDDIKESYNKLSMDYMDKVSVDVHNQISDFNNRIKEKEKQLKPYLLIKKIIMGIWALIAAALALLGYNRWKNRLEQRKMRGFEEMQQKMVRRAEAQAKRRVRSYTQNKTRQIVGDVRNKGRQAAQSKVRELGDRAKGKNTSSSGTETPDAGSQSSANHSSPGRRQAPGNKFPNRPSKPGGNGEITI